MIKQDWMVILAGEELVDRLTEETKRRVDHTGAGYSSSGLCALQRERAARGVLGAEVVRSNYGCSVRYDSGLQNFGLLASAKTGRLDGTLEHAVEFARMWVEQDPARRYAWMRKTTDEESRRREAVQREIDKDKRIGKGEARAIHALLRGRH